MINDIFYMKKAIKLAKNGFFTTPPNPNVGCIIINQKKIIGFGWHQKTGEHHAEIFALNMAKNETCGSTMYVTLEPCSHQGLTPPCCKKIVESGIKKVIIATLDPNPKVSGNGVKYLKNHGVLVKNGILEKEAIDINIGFFKRMKTGKPWIQLKLGMSIDGRTALNNGESKWITCKKSREDVYNFRAQSQVILTTSKTILLDNPLFNVNQKNKNKKTKKPILVIIDNKNKIKPNHYSIINNKKKIWIIRLKKDKEKWPKHVKQIIFEKFKKKINIKKLLEYFGKKNINVVWIESGPCLAGYFLEKKLIDELILYTSPKILGQTAKPLFELNNPIKNVNKEQDFIFHKIELIASDLKIILRKKNVSID
ncbi:MAG: bifunctional diaminohydroxyphosphoribosylaminopyrimidine deaminase/5-amino-6-(5-phosphoribosylamino)uracil reductase RibD [Buchnera aphidicola (Tetraneura sorini)]